MRGQKLRLNCIDEPIDCGHRAATCRFPPVSKGLDEPHTEAFALWTECDLYRYSGIPVHSYATSMNGLADQEDLRLRFDGLTQTKQPELHRYWTTRDRAAKRPRVAVRAGTALTHGVSRCIDWWTTARTA